MLTLDIVVGTHRPEGIARVAKMVIPKIDGVRYVVSWQNHQDAPIPAELLRDDIDIHRFDKSGVSNNRNNAIDHCTADVILTLDDDVIYSREQIEAVIKTFEENPEVDFATFKADAPQMPNYPKESCRLGDPVPKGYWVWTFNLSFRRKSIGNLRMHPELGLGSPKMHGAEEELFLLAAIRRGLNCRFFPIVICTHPQESTGTKATLTNANIRSMGCYMALAFPMTTILRLPLKAWRIKREGQAGLLRALRSLIAGAACAPAILRGDRRYLW